MSWLAASLVVLGLALVAGFAWYERSHPTSRVLALVATLAALAALGRIAFAPMPNVKPTTDIVLLTGYALGGAPGFAVGAVAALASNVFFGQGPWTPWQMCAWGGVGVGGALLARAFGRELGRGALAVACGVAGAGYGVVMNLHLWVTYSGDHSLAKLGAIFATSLPFDLAHVVRQRRLLPRSSARRSCARSAATGSASRSAGAPRRRSRPPLLAALVLADAAPLAGRRRRPRARALSWLESAQNADGGFGGAPGQRSSGLYTSWAGLGLAAAGRNPRDVGAAERRRRSPTCAPTRRAAAATSGTPRARSCSCARPAWRPRIGTRDLVRELLAKRRAVGLLRQPRQHDRVRDLRPARGGALDAATAPCAPARAGSPARPTPTAASTSPARAAAPGSTTPARRCRRSSPPAAAARKTVRRAARFLARRQNPDGGYPLQPGGPSNAQSTAWAVQALSRPAATPTASAATAPARRSPTCARSSTPSGAVRYSRTSAQTPVWVTAQALAALARKPFPLAPVAAPQGGPRRRGPTAGRRRPPPTPPRPPRPAGRRVRSASPPPHAPGAGTGDFGPPTPPDAGRPRVQSQARLAGYLAGTLL